MSARHRHHKDKIRDAKEQHAHCVRLLESYDAVIDDLGDWTETEWVFVRQRVEAMKADIVEEVARLALIVVELEASMPSPLVHVHVYLDGRCGHCGIRMVSP